jgi:hypothetical protein
LPTSLIVQVLLISFVCNEYSKQQDVKKFIQHTQAMHDGNDYTVWPLLYFTPSSSGLVNQPKAITNDSYHHQHLVWAEWINEWRGIWGFFSWSQHFCLNGLLHCNVSSIGWKELGRNQSWHIQGTIQTFSCSD